MKVWAEYNIVALKSQVGEVNTKQLAAQYGVTERNIRVAIRFLKKYYW